ncbi:MAG: LysE family translocator [Candidatus Bathyarchaeota archaeon]|nr:LysE family translocator [Candidatus Bathyarchaeum sp.]
MSNTNTQQKQNIHILEPIFQLIMDPFNFAATVIILTISGALAPGPLFFVTISHGMKSGAKSGVLFSISHTIIEFSLVMLLAAGLLTVANEPTVKLAVGTIGGVALVVFGFVQIRSSLKDPKQTNQTKSSNKNLLLIGLALTGLNPYFIIWWLTIGANLILISIEFAGILGVILMYICHVWVDYAWLILVAAFTKKGAKLLQKKWYKIMIASFGAVLIYFGTSFLVDALF